MGKILVITSGKGGVGKTLAVSNIAVALAKSGKKVLIADLDIGLRNLDIAVGMSDVIVYDIVDLLEGKCEFDRAVFKLDKYGELYFLPAAQSADKESLDPEKVKEFFLGLKNNYDYILIDCPAGIDNGFKSAIAAADVGIVVVVPEPSSVRDADKVINLMELEDVPEIRMIINRVRPDLIHKGDMISVDNVTDTLGVSPVGIITEDDAVICSRNKSIPVALIPGSPAGCEFVNIANRIEGKNIPIITLGSKRKGLFGKLFFS